MIEIFECVPCSITKPSELFFVSDWDEVLSYDEMIVNAVLEKYSGTEEDWKKCIDIHFKEFIKDCLNSSSIVERAVGEKFKEWSE